MRRMEQEHAKKMPKVLQNKSFQEIVKLPEKRKYKYFERYMIRWHKYGFQKDISKREAFQNSRADIQENWQDSRHIPFMRQLKRRTQKLNLSISTLSTRPSPRQNYAKLQEVLKRHPYLHTISLRTLGFKVEPALKAFIGGLKRLRNVRKVQIVIDKRRIQDEELQKLGRCLAGMTTLKHIEFISADSNSQHFSTPVKGLRAFGNGLKRLNSLEEVKLVFWRFEGQVLQAIGQGLKGMSSQSAKVNFMFQELCEKPDVEMLKLGLIEWSSIQNLGLDFYYCNNPNPRGIMALGESLPLINLLKRLKINLLGSITKEIFDVFTTGLQALSHLESLELKSFLSLEISDKGLKTLSKALKKLTSLKDFKFIYSSSQNLTKEGFHAFREAIEGAKCLEKLDLILQDSPSFHQILQFRLKVAPEVDDQDISQFMQSLETLPCLSNLTLNLQNFALLTDEGLNAIGYYLQRMSYLQKVQITFYLCKNVSKEKVFEFVQKLKGLQMQIECTYDSEKIHEKA